MTGTPSRLVDGARVRRLGADDAAAGWRLSSEAGWNQTLADWQFLLSWGRGYGVELPEQGLVGTSLVLPFGDDGAWVAMVLVSEPQRGRGLAGELVQRCLREATGQGRAVWLDATAMGAGLYTKLGFVAGERMLRLERPPGRWTHPSEAGPPVDQIRDASAVVHRDAKVLGRARPKLMEHLLARAPQSAWWTPSGAGLVLGRDGRRAHQIGPLVADGEAEARALMVAASLQVEGTLLIDVPARQTGWLNWLRGQGFVTRREFLRMALNGESLATDWSRTFATGGPDVA